MRIPRYSPDRKTNLLTVEECAAICDVSEKTVRRAMTRPGVYLEWHMVSGHRNKARKAFIDVATLGLVIVKPHGAEQALGQAAAVQTLTSTWTEQLDNRQALGQTTSDTYQARYIGQGAEGEDTGAWTSEMSKRSATTEALTLRNAVEVAVDLESARERLTKLQPILRLPKHRRAQAIDKLAAAEGVHPRSVRRWLADLEKNGITALAKGTRADKGKPRIPDVAYDLIVSCLLSNPPTTSTEMIHRTLMRAAPDAMIYSRGGTDLAVSPATVRRVKAALMQDPYLRTLFFNEDERREYMRTSNGTVMSNHANDLWEMDMTRCDTFVYDPETGEIYRLRVHAIIDVYSGCIPGIAFSRDEDQTQTDLALLRALLPKSGPLAEKYPIYGFPRRMYWDNGKTYRSQHAERILAELGVLSIHSKPRVSHTRGKIERFFRTLHLFEQAMPGYAGENATAKADEALKVLRKATLRWRETGIDPGYGKRLMTADEYKNAVAAWLIAEYHQHVVDGKTRLAHFTETAPVETRIIADPQELMLLFARRHTHTVAPDGSIRHAKQVWKIPGGALAAYSGSQVLVLEDQFVLQDRRLICFQNRRGGLDIIGEAVPAPTIANSLESGEQRRAERAVKNRVLADAKTAREALSNPLMTVVHQVTREAAITVEPLPAPAPTARLAALNPVTASEDADLDGWADDLADTVDITTMTPEQILAAAKRRHS